MKHRHIHAKSNEWIHVYRDNGGEGCLGIIVLLIIVAVIFKGC